MVLGLDIIDFRGLDGAGIADNKIAGLFRLTGTTYTHSTSDFITPELNFNL